MVLLLLFMLYEQQNGVVLLLMLCEQQNGAGV